MLTRVSPTTKLLLSFVTANQAMPCGCPAAPPPDAAEEGPVLRAQQS